METNKKPILIVISDLHLGGGDKDPGDDHVYNENQLIHFLENELKEANDGKIELYINGDFLEFAQVEPETYSLGSNKYWCSEKESIKKLEYIISGHLDIFKALNNFIKKGNTLTIAAGNHDVDLYWGKVQKRIETEIGNINFVIGKDGDERFDNRVLISHGHMLDPANKFKNWKNPILERKEGVPRLEMCPGTFFMVKFVNFLEEEYPFADNVKPFSALASILFKEDRGGFKTAAWLLTKFIAKHPVISLGKGNQSFENISEFGKNLKLKIQLDDEFAKKLLDLLSTSDLKIKDINTLRGITKTDDNLERILSKILSSVPTKEWIPVFDKIKTNVLQNKTNGRFLSILKSGIIDEFESLRKNAKNHILNNNKQIVVYGHTHQSDKLIVDENMNKGYFNPGSWTRYIEIDKLDEICLDQLKDEQNFPYQLNYIRIEESKSGTLRGDLLCYQKNRVSND